MNGLNEIINSKNIKFTDDELVEILENYDVSQLVIFIVIFSNVFSENQIVKINDIIIYLYNSHRISISKALSIIELNNKFDINTLISNINDMIDIFEISREHKNKIDVKIISNKLIDLLENSSGNYNCCLTRLFSHMLRISHINPKDLLEIFSNHYTGELNKMGEKIVKAVIV